MNESRLESPINTTPSTGVSTPGEYSSIHFAPRGAMASFENLVAMANYQERLKEARKMVWRHKGQPIVQLSSLEACFEHAIFGGIRSGLLAFHLRAFVNFMLALFRVRSVHRSERFTLIRRALLGSDSWRFAAMLGTFTLLYKFLLNALPLMNSTMNCSPSSSALDDEDYIGTVLPTTTVEVPLRKRSARLSLSAHAQLILIRKKTRRWHAALAGAVAGGLAILWEKRGRKGIIGQQLFVRGFQGVWNAYSEKRGFRIPHGDVLVFSLACGQIMYSFLLRPDSLPRSYTNWINQASQVPAEAVRMNMGLFREGKIDVTDLEHVLSLPVTTAVNKTQLLSFASSLSSSTTKIAPYAPCAAVHPSVTSCTDLPINRFVAVFKWMLPIYGALHLVPAVVFRNKLLLRNPGKVLLKAIFGSMRSSAFLGAFVVLFQGMFCFKHWLHRYVSFLRTGSSASIDLKFLPQSVVDLLVSRISFWMSGFFAGLALFVEEKRRRGELAMYALPKGLESMWVILRGKGWVFRTGKWGDVLLASVGVAMVMSTYQNDPQHLSGFVRRIMYQFIGPN